MSWEIKFSGNVRLVVREKLAFDQAPGQITGYGYEVWRGDEQLYWYDSQPHPSVPTLASTHSDHKHIPPDIKHHRIPAPGIEFDQSNPPFLIAEIRDIL